MSLRGAQARELSSRGAFLADLDSSALHSVQGHQRPGGASALWVRARHEQPAPDKAPGIPDMNFWAHRGPGRDRTAMPTSLLGSRFAPCTVEGLPKEAGLSRVPNGCFWFGLGLQK